LGAIADKPSERGEAVEMERWAEMMLRAVDIPERIAMLVCAFRMAMRGNMSPHTAVAAMMVGVGGLCRVVIRGLPAGGMVSVRTAFVAVTVVLVFVQAKENATRCMRVVVLNHLERW
jgi:ABC-type proline/glycine betaine transport system permease subunit